MVSLLSEQEQPVSREEPRKYSDEEQALFMAIHEQRYKAIRIGSRWLKLFLAWAAGRSDVLAIPVFNGLPEQFTIHSVTFDPVSNGFLVLIASPTYPIVAEGSEVERLPFRGLRLVTPCRADECPAAPDGAEPDGG